jgi:hypothetical protein
VASWCAKRLLAHQRAGRKARHIVPARKQRIFGGMAAARWRSAHQWRNDAGVSSVRSAWRSISIAPASNQSGAQRIRNIGGAAAMAAWRPRAAAASMALSFGASARRGARQRPRGASKTYGASNMKKNIGAGVKNGVCWAK